MAKPEIEPPFPVPTPEDYAFNAEHLEKEFNGLGGLWYLYNRESLVGTKSNMRTKDMFTGMSSIARMVEPITDNRFEPVDSMFRATHAFRAGMWTAGHLGASVFKGKVKFLNVHHALLASLPHTPRGSQQQYEDNGGYLKALGDQGLEIIGAEARGQIETWGKEVVSEESVRQSYALGTGAILAVYHQIYENTLPSLQEDYEVSKILKFDELEQYLSSNSDSSGN